MEVSCAVDDPPPLSEGKKKPTHTKKGGGTTLRKGGLDTENYDATRECIKHENHTTN